MPANNERVEIRAPAAEVDEWREAALAAALPLSEWLRRAARSVASPSPARAVLDDVRDFVRRQRATRGEAPQAWELHLTDHDELQLLQATAADVGAELAARILLEGPRGAFIKLYGLDVCWGAKNRSIAPRPDSRAGASA